MFSKSIDKYFKEYIKWEGIGPRRAKRYAILMYNFKSKKRPPK